MKLENPLLKIHLGCGSFIPPGWINIDGSWNALVSKWPTIKNLLKLLRIIPNEIANVKFDKNILIYDVRKPLPFKANSASAIYASHLLEHLYLSEAKALLKECYRILAIGGICRMVVPDLKSIILEYINNKLHYNEPKADIFIRKILLRSESPISGNILYKLYTIMKDYHSHKWMYDADSLTYHFRNAGFSNVRECGFRESLIDQIDVVEKPERVLNGAGICVEGIK